MSTKSSLTFSSNCKDDDHNLCWHLYNDMHQCDDVIVVEFYCSKCYCSYKMLMDNHLGKQLVDILKQHEEKDE